MKWIISLILTITEYKADPKGFVLGLLETYIQNKAKHAAQVQHGRTSTGKWNTLTLKEQEAKVSQQRAKMASRDAVSAGDIMQL